MSNYFFFQDKEIGKLGPYKTEGKYVPKIVFISKFFRNLCGALDEGLRDRTHVWKVVGSIPPPDDICSEVSYSSDTVWTENEVQ